MGTVTESIFTSAHQDVRNEVGLSLLRVEDHPFVRRANAGSLTRAEAHRWIMCAGRESRTFPQILKNMLATCTHPVIRNILQLNLDDEFGNGVPENAHFQHYLHLLDEISVSRTEFENYEEKAGINLAVDLALRISESSNLPRALGYMLVNEGMTPITYGAIKSAMEKFHPQLKTQFFDMHVIVDELHVAQLYRAIEELPLNAIDDVLFGVRVGERGMAVLLDEVVGLFDATN